MNWESAIRPVPVLRCRRPDVERREQACLPGQHGWPGGRLSGDASWPGPEQQHGTVALACPDSGGDEQRSTQGDRSTNRCQLEKPAVFESTYQLHRNVRDDKVNASDEAHTANLAEQCSTNYIRLRAVPDGRGTTDEIPATRHAQTFTSKW